MNIANISIRAPHLIAMMMLGLIVAGVMGFLRLPVDLLPDVSAPIVTVTTIYPGASPDEVLREVSERLEQALGSLNGVKNVTTTSSENVSVTVVEFNLEVSPVRAADDVREKVAVVRGSFPADAQDPIIQRFDLASQPILSIGIVDKTKKLKADELRRLIEDKLKPRFDRVDGVADVAISGGLVRQIQVNLKLDEMRVRRIAPQQVVAALQTENLNLPGGKVQDSGQEISVRTPGNFKSVDEINNIIIANPRGVPVYARDVATVQDGFADVVSYTRLNGLDSISVSIRKQSGTNTVRVADGVKEELKRLAKDYPDLSVTVAGDQSEFIKTSTDDSIKDLIYGGLFASLVVLFFFRDLRNTLVTVAGLPVIIIGTFAVMSFLGISLNLITLLALSLAVGLVIDDAIVVRENIFRHMERGETPKEASSRGTGEVSLAVLAMTFTVLSVFLPVAFTSGFIGKIFKDFGLTISIAVAISLIEAFTLAPMLSAYFFKQRTPKPGHADEDGMASSNLGWLDQKYRTALAWTLRHKKASALMGAAIFISIFVLGGRMDVSFFPSIDSGLFQVSLQLPPGTPLSKTDAVARQLESALRDVPDVQDVFATIGGEGSPERASFTVKMRETGLLAHAEPEIRRRFASVPGLALNFAGGGPGGGTGVTSRPIGLNINGSGTFEELDPVSNKVMGAIKDVPGIVDLDRSFQAGKPELHIDVDRARASRVGLSTAAVGATVRTLLNGQTATRYREAGREADIVVRLQGEDRNRIDDILSLSISSSSGQVVQLGNVASLTSSTGPTQIRRVNRQPQVVVGANFVGRTQAQVNGDVQARLKGLPLPPGITIASGSQLQQTSEGFSSLVFSMILSLVFVYMVLTSQFGSFLQPLVLMLALPLSFVGAFLALILARISLDLTAMIGLILLMGLVTKNSILLVDFTNRLREQGLGRDEALLRAGPIRLRPILMTTLALILGMIPVASGLGAGGSFRAPMAIAVIGGLITSTILTLLLVPVAYAVLDIMLGRLATLRNRQPNPKTTSASAPASE